MENASRVSAASDAPQATSQPQGETTTKKAGIGSGGWNEDFDEAWGRRVLENPKLKEMFGLSDYGSLRDEGTRREINRWLQKNRGGEGPAMSSTTSPASSSASSTAPSAAPAAKPGEGEKTTGKASMPGGMVPPPSGPPKRSTSILAPGTLPSSTLWRNTIVPASGGEIPQANGAWWPSYPVGGGTPPATSPGVASMQAAALEQQGGR